MSARITYFLGAGASYHSIPTVKDLPVRMKLFFEMLKLNMTDEEKSNSDISTKINEYDGLLRDIERYGTPDTLARNFFLTSKTPGISKELCRLKCLLSCYIIFEQLEKPDVTADQIIEVLKRIDNLKEVISENERIKTAESLLNPLDRRYTSFFATILDKTGTELKLPSNVNLISWNYDGQVERGYQDFNPGLSICGVQDALNVTPQIKKSQTVSSDPVIERFSVIKLNGTGAFSTKDSLNSCFDLYHDKLSESNWQDFQKLMFAQREESPNRFSFAWERTESKSPIFVKPEDDKTSLNTARDKAKKIMSSSDIVVVIGYSFPDFNRSIDKQIFSGFNGTLYLQDPEADKIAQKIRGVNQKIKKEQIELITEPSNFFIPFEYWE